jgi:hypothetical protein
MSNDGKSLSKGHKLTHQFLVVVWVSVSGAVHHVERISLSLLSARWCFCRKDNQGDIDPAGIKTSDMAINITFGKSKSTLWFLRAARVRGAHGKTFSRHVGLIASQAVDCSKQKYRNPII